MRPRITIEVELPNDAKLVICENAAYYYQDEISYDMHYAEAAIDVDDAAITAIMAIAEDEVTRVLEQLNMKGEEK